jgi:hypothetical protein
LYRRHTTLTTSEDDEKTNTTEDEKTSVGLTTTEYSRRTCQCSMWLNSKSLPAVHSSKIYRQHRTTIISFGSYLLVWLTYHHHRISTTMFESTSNVVIYPSRVERVSIPSLLHRYVGMYINQTSRLIVGDVQGVMEDTQFDYERRFSVFPFTLCGPKFSCNWRMNETVVDN